MKAVLNGVIRKEIYFGNCLQNFAAVRNLLGAHGIRYEYRIVDQTYKGRMAGTHRGRTHFGNAGIHFDTAMLYYVYVKKQDYENARYPLDCNDIGRAEQHD